MSSTLMISIVLIFLLGVIVSGLVVALYFRNELTKVKKEEENEPLDEQISELVDDSHEDVATETKDMMLKVLYLPQKRVREIMVPGPYMVTADDSMTLDEIVNVILDCGHSRIPVKGSGDDKESVIGLVYSKDVLKKIHIDKEDTDWLSLIREPYVVPESAPVDKLLRELQSREIHMAMVVNEFGDLTGLCTIEDVLEEIVGEIVDEHDDEHPLITEAGDGYWQVNARLSVSALSEVLGLDLPDDDWDTVGGLAFNTAGYVPEVGDVILVEDVTVTGLERMVQSVQLRIDSVDGNRMESIHVTKMPMHERVEDKE